MADTFLCLMKEEMEVDGAKQRTPGAEGLRDRFRTLSSSRRTPKVHLLPVLPPFQLTVDWTSVVQILPLVVIPPNHEIPSKLSCCKVSWCSVNWCRAHPNKCTEQKERCFCLPKKNGSPVEKEVSLKSHIHRMLWSPVFWCSKDHKDGALVMALCRQNPRCPQLWFPLYPSGSTFIKQGQWNACHR